MVIITPEERAVSRAAYMHSLALALINGNALHWWSASGEERTEVRDALGRHLKFPSERQLILREVRRLRAELKAAENLVLKAAKREKAAARKNKAAKTE